MLSGNVIPCHSHSQVVLDKMSSNVLFLSCMSGVSDKYLHSYVMDKHSLICFVLMAFKLPRFPNVVDLLLNMGYIELKLF